MTPDHDQQQGPSYSAGELSGLVYVRQDDTEPLKCSACRRPINARFEFWLEDGAGTHVDCDEATE